MASETHSADEPPLIKCPSPCDTAISWLTGEEKCPRCGKLAPSQLRLTRSQFDTIVDYCFSTTSSSSRDTSFVVDRTLLGQLTSQIAGRPTPPLEGLPVQRECVSASEFDGTHDETISERQASTNASSALHVGGSGHDDDKDDDVITIIDEDDKSIMCPEGYDKDCFDSLPPHIKSEVCEEAASVALARKLSGRINESKSKREVAGLCDFNTPGLRGIAPNTTAAVTSLDRHPTRVLREKKCDVTVRNFLPGRDADDSSMQAVGDKPIYFHMDDIGTKITWPSNYVLGIAEDLKKEILSHFSATDNMQEEKERKLVEIPELIFDGYFKGRLNNEFSSKFSETLPNTFQVKKNASQKGIVFLNTKDGQCDTHYDRDASVLFLITGYKEVLIAPPRRIASVSAAGNESNSTIFSDIDPFAEDKKGDWEWKKVNLTPGSALYIPQDYLHCIRSTEDTLALSFQVEPYRQSSSSSSSRSNKRKRQRHRSDRAPVPRESPVDHMISAAAAISSLASTAATASVSTPAAVADAPAVPAAASVANKSSSGRSTFPSRHIVDGQKRTCATTGTGSPRPSPPAHADSEPPSARSAAASVSLEAVATCGNQIINREDSGKRAASKSTSSYSSTKSETTPVSE